MIQWETKNALQNLYYKPQFSRQYNCHSDVIGACRRSSSYIFILDLTPGFNSMGTYNGITRRGTFQFWDLAHLILEVSRQCSIKYHPQFFDDLQYRSRVPGCRSIKHSASRWRGEW